MEKNCEYYRLIVENNLLQDIEEEYLKIINDIEKFEDIEKRVHKELDNIEKRMCYNNIKIEIMKLQRDKNYEN